MSAIGRKTFKYSIACQVRNISNDAEWAAAKSFDDIPTQSFFFNVKRLPFGPLYKRPMDDWHPYFQKKYGNIIKFSGGFGRSASIAIYDPEDMQKVYRNEGQYPERLGLDSWMYWRKTRNDLFKNFKGLVLE